MQNMMLPDLSHLSGKMYVSCKYSLCDDDPSNLIYIELALLKRSKLFHFEVNDRNPIQSKINPTILMGGILQSYIPMARVTR